MRTHTFMFMAKVHPSGDQRRAVIKVPRSRFVNSDQQDKFILTIVLVPRTRTLVEKTE